MHVTSPCVSDCTIDPRTNTCRGCYRTLDEISKWSIMTNEEKQKVLDRIFGDDDAETPKEC